MNNCWKIFKCSTCEIAADIMAEGCQIEIGLQLERFFPQIKKIYYGLKIPEEDYLQFAEDDNPFSDCLSVVSLEHAKSHLACLKHIPALKLSWGKGRICLQRCRVSKPDHISVHSIYIQKFIGQNNYSTCPGILRHLVLSKI